MWEVLVNLYKKLNEGQELNEDTVKELINKYPDLADTVIITENGYSLEKDTIVSLANTHVKYLNQIAAYEYEHTREQLENVKKIIEAYESEYRASHGIGSNRPIEAMASRKSF